jgi:hypothetical protein
MTTPAKVTAVLGNFPLGDIANHLDQNWKKWIVKSNGDLNKAGLQRQIDRRKKIPELFLTAIRTKYPDLPIPDNPQTDDPAATTPAEVSTTSSIRTRSYRSPPVARAAGEVVRQPLMRQAIGEDAIVEQDTPLRLLDAYTTDLSVDSDSEPEIQSNYRPRGPQPGANEVEEPLTFPEEEGGENGRPKRKFSWLTHEWAGATDEWNQREADGTLKAISNFTGAYKEGDFEIHAEKAVPEGFQTDAMIDHWNAIFEVNGRVFYDSERLALGSLSKSEYMLIPNNWNIDICPIENIGAGLASYQVKIPTMAAVYALAKKQAQNLKMTDDDQVRWALLRLEAFKAGWFDRQKYCMYVKAPDNSMQTMQTDMEKILPIIDSAYSLCSFVPFMTEYHFRSFGNAYNKSSATEFINKAQDLATSASIVEHLGYMNPDILYGKALIWIGVRRPMLVLRNAVARLRVPNPFRIRAYSAPSGQAIISTSIAVIESLQSAGWWDGVRSAGHYDVGILLAVGEAIARNPWRYHMMYHVYGEEVLTIEDNRRLDMARKEAVRVAPILHAYAVTVMKDAPLGRIKALKQYADNNKPLFKKAQSLFQRVLREKSKNIMEVFAAEDFNIPAAS